MLHIHFFIYINKYINAIRYNSKCTMKSITIYTKKNANAKSHLLIFANRDRSQSQFNSWTRINWRSCEEVKKKIKTTTTTTIQKQMEKRRSKIGRWLSIDVCARRWIFFLVKWFCLFYSLSHRAIFFWIFFCSVALLFTIHSLATPILTRDAERLVKQIMFGFCCFFL